MMCQSGVDPELETPANLGDRFFKKSLAAYPRTAPAAGTEYRLGIHQHIEKEQQAGTRLSIEQMCELGEVSRAGWYRRGAAPPGDGDVELRGEIQKIALDWPAYGSRRITAELRRRGWTVNRKRIQRFMRETICCACGNGSSW